jgi:hypothetical protein
MIPVYSIKCSIKTCKYLSNISKFGNYWAVNEIS